MGIFTQQRQPYVPPTGDTDTDNERPSPGAGTMLGGLPPAANNWLNRLAPAGSIELGFHPDSGSDSDPGTKRDPNIALTSDGEPGTVEDTQIAQPPAGVVPRANSVNGGLGQPVVLPDGSIVPDQYSPTGKLMSPVADLSDVAAEARRTADTYRILRFHPATFEAGLLQYGTQFGLALGHGGKFDYQRGPGNSIIGFEQRPQFRNVSNVNVGLFGQQAGMSLDDILKQAGEFASMRSSNSRPDEPYGLDTRTREFIELGYRIGESGVFGSPAIR